MRQKKLFTLRLPTPITINRRVTQFSRGILQALEKASALTTELFNESTNGVLPEVNFPYNENLLQKISNNTFHGDFPKELAHLQRLKVINDFTGAVPSFLSLLPNLGSVYRSSNQFSGKIPSCLSNLTKLEVLNLERNFLEGEIPWELGDLLCLTFLNLQLNHLSGSIPPSIFNIKTMQHIGFTYNNLTGKLPTTMCDHLPNLEGFYLSRNYVGGVIPPNLEKCIKLHEVLSLTHNEFAGTFPRNLSNLTALKRLYIGSLHLEGSSDEMRMENEEKKNGGKVKCAFTLRKNCTPTLVGERNFFMLNNRSIPLIKRLTPPHVLGTLFKKLQLSSLLPAKSHTLPKVDGILDGLSEL
ncbi:hypothetical protein CQW23_31652 [Capsicum baccatum]|uniref:Uncharacterized protein n=1 Tax=Capsicum baccatum TaxID=33114 RepID=A0A2G2V760_CAPBA|nr:hypothetical protein CQW23_31652 [Capsicum baccatum]